MFTNKIIFTLLHRIGILYKPDFDIILNNEPEFRDKISENMFNIKYRLHFSNTNSEISHNIESNGSFKLSDIKKMK